MAEQINENMDLEMKALLEDPEIIGLADRLGQDLVECRRGGMDAEPVIRRCVDVYLENFMRSRSEGRDVVLAAVHRILCSRGLRNFIELLKFVQGASFNEIHGSLVELVDVGHLIKGLGFDRPMGQLTESPYGWPFHEIDVVDPLWVDNLHISENFSHSLYRIFDVHSFAYIVDALADYAFDNLRYASMFFTFVDDISVVLPVLEAFERQLSMESVREDVDVEQLAGGVCGVLNVRYRENLFETGRLLIGQKVSSGVVVENSDYAKLTMALFEIAKNSFRAGKFEEVDLAQYAERGENYLTISAAEMQLNNEDVVVIEIHDKGQHIDVAKVIAKMGAGLHGWGARDVTLGEMLDSLSRRHMSIPLDENAGEIHSGIGLHSARRVIQEHNGELFAANLPDGVGFLVVIPKEGQESDWNVSDLRVSGLQCEELAEKLSAYTRDFRKVILAALAMSIVDSQGARSALSVRGRGF